MVAILYCAAAAISCDGPAVDALAHPTVDTLASGAQRILSPSPTRWRDTTGWKLVEELRILGEERTLSEVTNPVSLALDDGGNLYLGDQSPATIKVYDRNGRFVRAIGREGAGPGEFRIAFIATHGPHLVVHDPILSRTSVFDTTGTFLRSWPSACCFFAQIDVDSTGVIYIPTNLQGGGLRTSGVAVLRFTVDGDAVDTLIVAPGEERKLWPIKSGDRLVMARLIPYTTGMLWTVHPHGGVVYGSNRTYEVVFGHTGRDTVQVFGRTWTPDVVTEETKRDTIDAIATELGVRFGKDNVLSQIHAEDIPDHAPAYTDLRVDRDGNRWVRIEPSPGHADIRFDVFDANAWYLGPVSIGMASFDAYAPQYWGRAEVAVAVTDPDGRPTIVRYRVQR